LATETSPGQRGRSQIDLADLTDRLFRSRTAQFAWFLVFSLLTRASVFGDTDYHNDELFYALVGQRMHNGLLPYVDLWDRKGPGLFLTFYAIAAFSHAVIAYQVAAWLCAAATALVANMIAERFTSRLGALLGGTLYLVLLPLFSGGGGQAPVFYNLPMALAALGVMSALPALQAGRAGGRVYLAMLAAGFAITFKQTAAIEGGFFGLFALWQLHRSRASFPRIATTGVKLILTGAAPMLVFAAVYALLGHFAEFWHAMVTSNLVKPYNPGNDTAKRIAALATIIGPALLPALAGLAMKGDRTQRGFLAGWLLAAAGGVAIVPNYIDHYMLPLTLPVAVAAARMLGYRMMGSAYGYAIILFWLFAGPSLHFADRQASRAAMAGLVRDIASHDPHPRLFVFQGPVELYGLMHTFPPTPLFFPMHLSHWPERNTSHLDTADEVRKVLAWQPTIVVTAAAFPDLSANPETNALVRAYVARCRVQFTRTIIDYYGPQPIKVYADCAPPAALGDRMAPVQPSPERAGAQPASPIGRQGERTTIK
jgi:hypothetical protein